MTFKAILHENRTKTPNLLGKYADFDHKMATESCKSGGYDSFLGIQLYLIIICIQLDLKVK